VKLLIHEDLSPLLAARCAEKGIYAVAVVHVGLSSRKDRAVWQYAFENDLIVVTINARDFLNLIEDEAHPGLIILREGDLSRDEQMEPARAGIGSHSEACRSGRIYDQPCRGR
jgi:predicted nuclease of predicted toxin-antitoxin system